MLSKSPAAQCLQPPGAPYGTQPAKKEKGKIEKCAEWASWIRKIPVVGKGIADGCEGISKLKTCWTAWREGGDAWKEAKTGCSAVVLVVEIAAIIIIAALVWIGYPYFSTAIDYTQGLRQTVNSIMSKLWAPVDKLFGWLKSAVGVMLGWMDGIGATLGVSPLLLKINFVSLIVWASLVAGFDAEGFADDFFSGVYGDFGEHVYTIFSFFTWPERKAVELAGEVWGPLGWLVGWVASPFEIAAFIFSLPVALVLYPLLELVDGLRADIKRISTNDPEAAAKALEWAEGKKSKTALDRSDAVPSAVPERVCSGCE